MSSIVTFYSYKGGVGRSMALANIAVLLARRGLRVLAVDWDLEAPGLERYFSYFPIEIRGTGLLSMFIGAAKGGGADYKDFICEVNCDADHPLSFLPSGRDQDSEYANNLESFDWADFFRNKNGGRFVEDLRTRWRKDFDIVLIDSRTGLSDTGGICTIQLPDIVVAMFTANHQSLYGTRDVLRLAQHARQALAYDRMPLTALPLPARFGTRAEFTEAQDWLKRFEEALQEFFDDWLPRTMRAKQVLERIKVPQVDYFAFGEKLAVMEQGTNDPEGMGFVYDKVATLLTSDFADIEAVVGHDVIQEQKAAKKRRSKVPPPIKSTTEDYRYDIFVSFGHSTLLVETAQEIISHLRSELELYMSEVEIFFDVTELSPSTVFAEQVREALLHSKLLLALVTPVYFQNKFSTAEFLTFKRRSDLAGTPLILPVVLSGHDFPEFFNQYQYTDLSDVMLSGRRSVRSRDFQLRIRELASLTVKLLEGAPPFNPNWPEVSLEVAEASINKSRPFPIPRF